MTDPKQSSVEAARTVAPQPPEQDTISLLDIGLVFAEYGTLVRRVVLAFAALGILIALLSPVRFSSTAHVFPEDESEAGLLDSRALSAIRGFGVNLGSQTGLTPDIYPEIVKSREVFLAVARDTFYFAELGRRDTFVSYVAEKNNTLAKKIRRNTIGVVSNTVRGWLNPPVPTVSPQQDVELLNKRELDAIYELSNYVTASSGLQTTLLEITVTSGDAMLSAALAQSFVHQLRERVRAIRTQKTRENVAFITQQYDAAERELQLAETALAEFDDRNNNPQSARLRTERERLMRKVTFAMQLFSDLQMQRTQAQIELQRSEPVLTVLENPSVPMNPSEPKRFLIVISCIVLGLILGTALALLVHSVEKSTVFPEEYQKLQTIKAAFLPKRWQT